MLLFQVKLSPWPVLGQLCHQRFLLLLSVLSYIGFDILFKYLFISISERRGWDSWNCLAWRREVSGGDFIIVYKYLVEGCRDDGARLFAVVHGERARGNRHNLKCRDYHLQHGKKFSLWGLLDAARGSSGRAWSLHPWTYLEPNWTHSWSLLWLTPDWTGAWMQHSAEVPSDLFHCLVILWNTGEVNVCKGRVMNQASLQI